MGGIPGLRALVLYPLNALAEDQMARLRQAPDRARGRTSSPGRARVRGEHDVLLAAHSEHRRHRVHGEGDVRELAEAYDRGHALIMSRGGAVPFGELRHHCALSDGALYIIGVWDSEEEARNIGEEIEQLQREARERGEDHPLDEIAILVRASFQMREFEDRFIQLGLPYRVIGGPRFYERAEIKDAFVRVQRMGGKDEDPVARVTGSLSLLDDQLKGIREALGRAVTERQAAQPSSAQQDALRQGLECLNEEGEPRWALRATAGLNNEELLGALVLRTDLLRKDMIDEFD